MYIYNTGASYISTTTPYVKYGYMSYGSGGGLTPSNGNIPSDPKEPAKVSKKDARPVNPHYPM